MEETTVRVAVVTVSDSSSAGLREDRSGPAVVERCQGLGWTVVRTETVPDDQTRIARLLVDLCGGGSVDLALTTGGTGIAPRDVTPEATRAVIERELPGF